MRVGTRALLIGVIGPVMQAVGFAWQASHLLLLHWGDQITARHLFYEPGTLLIITGFFVTIVCLPVALQVAQASEADVRIPVYEPETVESTQTPRARAAR